MAEEPKESFIASSHDRLIDSLNRIIILSVKFMAVLMVFVIIWAQIDVIVHIYDSMMTSVNSRFNTDQLIAVLGSFLAVLIAIEIFLNIIFYLKRDAVHVPLVLATALTAVARKVIIIDYSAPKASVIYGTAALVMALGVTYWLVTKNQSTEN